MSHRVGGDSLDGFDREFALVHRREPPCDGFVVARDLERAVAFRVRQWIGRLGIDGQSTVGRRDLYRLGSGDVLEDGDLAVAVRKRHVVLGNAELSAGTGRDRVAEPDGSPRPRRSDAELAVRDPDGELTDAELETVRTLVTSDEEATERLRTRFPNAETITLHGVEPTGDVHVDVTAPGDDSETAVVVSPSSGDVSVDAATLLESSESSRIDTDGSTVVWKTDDT